MRKLWQKLLVSVMENSLKIPIEFVCELFEPCQRVNDRNNFVEFKYLWFEIGCGCVCPCLAVAVKSGCPCVCPCIYACIGVHVCLWGRECARVNSKHLMQGARFIERAWRRHKKVLHNNMLQEVSASTDIASDRRQAGEEQPKVRRGKKQAATIVIHCFGGIQRSPLVHVLCRLLLVLVGPNLCHALLAMHDGVRWQAVVGGDKV